MRSLRCVHTECQCPILACYNAVSLPFTAWLLPHSSPAHLSELGSRSSKRRRQPALRTPCHALWSGAERIAAPTGHHARRGLRAIEPRRRYVEASTSSPSRAGLPQNPQVRPRSRRCRDSVGRRIRPTTTRRPVFTALRTIVVNYFITETATNLAGTGACSVRPTTMGRGPDALLVAGHGRIISFNIRRVPTACLILPPARCFTSVAQRLGHERNADDPLPSPHLQAGGSSHHQRCHHEPQPRLLASAWRPSTA